MCSKLTPSFGRVRYGLFLSILQMRMIYFSVLLVCLSLWGVRHPSWRQTERSSSTCIAEDAALTGRAYRLCSFSLQTWLPLTAPTADKSENIKENRRGTQLTYQCFFSSSPPPPPQTSIFNSSSLQSSSPQNPSSGCQNCREGEVTSQEFASSLEAHHVSGSLSCVRLPPPQASCDPALVSAHQGSSPRRGGKEGEKKINRMFFHLVNWQHRLLEPLSQQAERSQIGRGKNWQVKAWWIIELGWGVRASALLRLGFQKAS